MYIEFNEKKIEKIVKYLITVVYTYTCSLES